AAPLGEPPVTAGPRAYASGAALRPQGNAMELPPISDQLAGNLGDAHFPAYTMSAATALLGVQPGFLRGLGEAGLLSPARSTGGHRRFSRDDLEVAARAREI